MEAPADFVKRVREKLLNAAGDARTQGVGGIPRPARAGEARGESERRQLREAARAAHLPAAAEREGAAWSARRCRRIAARAFRRASRTSRSRSPWRGTSAGGCWVAETRDYPHGVTPDGEGNDDIKICEDTDGDGKADKFTVFADKLNLPTSLVFAQRRHHRRAAAALPLPQGHQRRRQGRRARGDHRRLGHPRHARAGEQSALRLRQLALRLRRLLRLQGRRSAGKLLDFTHGHVSLQGRRHRRSSSCTSSPTTPGGTARTRRAINFGGTANNAPLFYGGIPQRGRARRACGR